MTDAPRRPENCTCRGDLVRWCQPCLDSGWLDALGQPTLSDNADLTPLQRQIEARAYQNTLHEARSQFKASIAPQPPAQLIDTWSAHISRFGHDVVPTTETVIQAQARIGQLERELADMTAELAYANLRMTVAIQTSNQLIEAEVDRRKAEAEAVAQSQPAAFVDPDIKLDDLFPGDHPQWPMTKHAFPARALAPQRRDGWIMVR
jgi:hypothetical protein